MVIIEHLSRYIFEGLGQDYSNYDVDTKKVIYQLLYIGLVRLYGSEHFTVNDVSSSMVKATNGMDMVRVNILGKDSYFYSYGTNIQAINPASEVIFNIELKNNNYELYVRDTFNIEYRYGIQDVSNKRASKYSYMENQGDRYISHGDLITISNPRAPIENIFKMIVYDLNTGEVIPDDDSLLKRIHDSLTKDNSTNTSVGITFDNLDGQIFNITKIFEVFKVRLDRFYQGMNKDKKKNRVLK